MFLKKVMERNPELLRFAMKLHKDGDILPDTYVLDLDAIVNNAKEMKKAAEENGVRLYFMLKQIGRNPLIAQKLMEVGFDGAVCVDYKEALLMIENGIHIANVGHLEQIPYAAMDRIIAAAPDYVTVYSKEIIAKIDETAKKYGLLQKLLIRLSDDDSKLYSGQVGGFHSRELNDLFDWIEGLENVKVGGLTVFPAFLYDEKENTILPTDNMNAMERGRKIAWEYGLKDLNINLPSANCTASIPLIASCGGTSGEPGHGLTGTTPLHKYNNEPEIPAYVYVSEISHNYEGKSFCYGGGHYRRGHMENVLVGNDLESAVMKKICAPADDSIDYHFEIENGSNVGDCALMAFRTQIFTTRSAVAVVSGIHEGEGKLLGLYTSLGEPMRKNW